jgi:hypothetical protein
MFHKANSCSPFVSCRFAICRFAAQITDPGALNLRAMRDEWFLTLLFINFNDVSTYTMHTYVVSTSVEKSVISH